MFNLDQDNCDDRNNWGSVNRYLHWEIIAFLAKYLLENKSEFRKVKKW